MTKEKDGNNGAPQPVQVIPYEIPVEGSLGLLALGAVGLKAWRKKREEAAKKGDRKNG